MPPVRATSCGLGSGKRPTLVPEIFPYTVMIAEPLRAVGTNVGAFHMLTRHGLSGCQHMGASGQNVKPQ